MYPGKGFNAWWDLPQLLQQVKHVLAIFEHTHLDCIGVWVFNRLSAHEGYADNALNINSININPGGKQKKLRDTKIVTAALTATPRSDLNTQVESFRDEQEVPLS
jgi:hypothetical protein